MEIESDQKIRTKTHALPTDKQQDVIVGQDESQHGEHEEVEISEESVISALHAPCNRSSKYGSASHASDEQQPDAGKRIEQETCIGAETPLEFHRASYSSYGRCQCPAMCRESSDRADGSVASRGPRRVLRHRTASHQKRQHDGSDADGADRRLLQLRPKKNIIAAPKAGSSGISQMWERKISF